MHKLYFCLLIGLLFSRNAISADDVLIINSYGSSMEWSGKIEKSFRQELKNKIPEVRIYNEYLNAFHHSSPEAWEETMALILKYYTQHPPKIIVLIADPAWMAYRATYRGQFRDINVLLCGVKEKGLSLEKYKSRKKIRPADFIPTEQLCFQYNATGILEKLYVRQTLELIRRLQPETEEIINIGDNSFYGLYTHILIEEYLQETSSSLKYTSLDGRFLTTDSLYGHLSGLSPRAGIVLSSWLLDAKEETQAYPQVYPRIVQLANRPVYALNDWGNTGQHFTGGYYSTSHNYGKELAGMAVRILSGENAGDIPLTSNVRETGIHLNMAKLRQYGLKLVPFAQEKIYYYNIPPGFFRRHQQPIIILTTLVVLACLLFLTVFTRTRFSLYRKKLHLSQNRIDTSVSNQQHLSNALRIFLQEETEKDSVNKILREMLREMSADRAYIFEFDDLRHTSSNTYEVCSAHISTQLQQLQNIPNSNIPWLYQKMQDDQLLILEDLPASKGIIPDAEYHLLRAQGILSLYVAPLYSEGKLWGYMGVDYVCQKRKYDQQNLLYLKNLAQVLCIGIEHFRSEKRTRLSLQKVAELEALFSYASAHANVGFAQWNPITCEGFATAPWFGNLRETTHNIRDVIGVYQYMHPDDRKALNAYTDSVLSGEREPFITNIRIQTPQGWHWYKYHVTCRTDSTHQPELIFLSIDIDNLKKTEDSLRQAKARAEESDKLKSAFIANMSHEIRTPLNAIVGFSTLLANNPDLSEEEKAEYLQLITTNNEILLQLINDILDISKIEAGILNFSEDIIELDSFCQELEAIYTRRVQPGVEVRFIRKSPASYTLTTDHTRLHQVLSNLLNNAVKFTSAGHIYFGYEVTDTGIRFYVEDTGIGIPAEKQKEIFERFVKLNSFAQGTGLGLSICHTIVTKFGGQINVESTPGQGSLFRFTLPRN